MMSIVVRAEGPDVGAPSFGSETRTRDTGSAEVLSTIAARSVRERRLRRPCMSGLNGQGGAGKQVRTSPAAVAVPVRDAAKLNMRFKAERFSTVQSSR